ncbi:hypothetical protein C2E20_8625 [Micractinium conductrix]|uniref:Fibronectin type-III domain-containing protein n=1 Tax=Micractinium conductrix TaxID=554055 RepID=A0A2P6V0Z8_9CHLO|nr:hypothetical protein C2E20_8625 [Micractinium conductrix]|eukprot:PSC67753.1 hypothetical protein C2E20_8625 [Micractinium conductrix]
MPSIAALSAPDPFNVPACGKAGEARSAAGCGLLSVLVKPPAKTDGPPVRLYRVVCSQGPRCTRRGASRRSLAGTCQVMEATGAGTPAGGGQLRFQLPFPFFNEWTGFRCSVTCRSTAGWSAASQRKAVRIPPSPPPLPPQVMGISSNASGIVIVRVQKPKGGQGVNGYLAVGTMGNRRTRSSAAGHFESESAAIAGSEVNIFIPPGTYTPGKLYTIMALYKHKDEGVGQLFSPPSAAEEFTMPDLAGGEEEEGPPGTPSIASLYSPSPYTTPACASAGNAYGEAGCGVLTVRVDKPSSDGGQVIEEYLVVCKPTWCPDSAGAGRRLLGALSVRNPCTFPAIASGLGTPVQGGRLGRVQFELPMDQWQTTTYGCNVTCRNSLGWSLPSYVSTTEVPPMPPPYPPFLDITVVDNSKLKFCLRELSGSGATSWEVVGTPSDGGAQVTAGSAVGSSTGGLARRFLEAAAFCFPGFPCPPGRGSSCPTVDIGSRPGVTFSFTAWYKKTVQPGDLVLLSQPSTSTLTVPAGPPPPPVITSVAFLANDGSTYISATVTVQRPTTPEALVYAIHIEGGTQGERTLQAPDAISVSTRLDGAKVLTFAAAFTPGVEYTFKVVATSSAGGVSSEPKLATPRPIA